MEKHYEMLWDCQFCGTKKLLGKTHRFCPNCGASQNTEARYYPSDDEKVAVEDHVLVGADRICSNCDSLLAATVEFCGNCGSATTDAKTATLREQQERKEGERFSGEIGRNVQRIKHEAQVAQAQAQAQPKRGNPIGIIIGVVIVLVAGAIWAFTRTAEATVMVEGHSWERVIEVESYQSVSESNWRDTVPVSAYSMSCSQRQRSTERIQTGESCNTVRRDNGDGTFSESESCQPTYREEPVYDDYCTYRVDRWAFARDVVTQGDSLKDTPQWGDVSLNCANQTRLGCEREGNRTESYLVQLEGDDGSYECKRSQDQWASMPLESSWLLEVTSIGNSPVCDTLQPQ